MLPLSSTLIAAVGLTALPAPEPPEWLYVSPGILQGISGIALVSDAADKKTFLVVHDDKDESMPDEPRAGLLDVERGKWPSYRRLTWIGQAGQATPKDLEAVTSLPGDSRYLATTSKGQLFLLSLDIDNRALKVQASATILPKDGEIEGLSVASIGGNRVMIWGDRGKEGKGMLWWTRLDANLLPGAAPAGVEIKSPWSEMGRAIADLKIDSNGVVSAVAAEDKGNFGPFASGLYTAGKLVPAGDGYTFTADQGSKKFFTGGHKIEGMEFISDKVIFGTDDESFGSSVWFDFWTP